VQSENFSEHLSHFIKKIIIQKPSEAVFTKSINRFESQKVQMIISNLWFKQNLTVIIQNITSPESSIFEIRVIKEIKKFYRVSEGVPLISPLKLPLWSFICWRIEHVLDMGGYFL